MLGFYVGGMGAKGQNYHTKLMARMGFEAEAHQIQDLFLEGRRDEAVAAVPDRFADEISLVGTPDRIRDRLHAFEESPVTMLNVAPRSSDHLRQVAELILA
jgi:alkanesulfonate monooxygenase SsuD/methylene tetrahydromethanopterin reductase-like flavin-dependent oxidoreductase (luciferase family)